MKINISIDDVSPHPLSSIRVIERCNEIISIFPSAKFSLFVPIAYWRTVKHGTTTDKPLSIDLFPDFCNFISKLSKENFEICYHGFYHGIPGISDNDEFQRLNADDAKQKFQTMFEVVDRASGPVEAHRDGQVVGGHEVQGRLQAQDQSRPRRNLPAADGAR